MPESTLTPEQANELSAKQELADALADIRKHANSARNRAQEIIHALEEVIKAIPAGVTADNLDIPAIATAVDAARAVELESFDADRVKRQIERMEGALEEAMGQAVYLNIGDFSDDLA